MCVLINSNSEGAAVQWPPQLPVAPLLPGFCMRPNLTPPPHFVCRHGACDGQRRAHRAFQHRQPR